MKKTTTIFFALLCMTTMTMAKKHKTVTLQLVGTSDVHGAFFPYDFIERTPMQGTMARVSTYLKRQRQQYGKNLILLENGDILQGQPTCYYTNYVKTDLPNVAAEVATIRIMSRLTCPTLQQRLSTTYNMMHRHSAITMWKQDMPSTTNGFAN